MPTLVEIRALKKLFPIRSVGVFAKTAGYVRAVEEITFSVEEGETVGIVGESGCGKSTTGRLILRLIEPTSGQVLFAGNDLLKLSFDDLRRMRRQMQFIFQDPYASLNPRMRVGSIIEEPLIVHSMGSAMERQSIVTEMLSLVGLNPAQASLYPHEFSGGQRQRLAIARALVTRPRFVIADEPVSALDVSIQSQILNLMKDLQDRLGLTYIFISHDLSVVRHVSDKVGVMYLGRIVEFARTSNLYAHPFHPYTQALLSAIPRLDRKNKSERIILQGEIPSPANPPPGCTFHTRCRECMPVCREIRPETKKVADGHEVACHLY